jgi:putative NADPH-quinone reductase
MQNSFFHSSDSRCVREERVHQAPILSFSLWWFGLLAVLKGWVDRVFAMGRTYGAGRFISPESLGENERYCP